MAVLPPSGVPPDAHLAPTRAWLVMAATFAAMLVFAAAVRTLGDAGVVGFAGTLAVGLAATAAVFRVVGGLVRHDQS